MDCSETPPCVQLYHTPAQISWTWGWVWVFRWVVFWWAAWAVGPAGRVYSSTRSLNSISLPSSSGWLALSWPSSSLSPATKYRPLAPTSSAISLPAADCIGPRRAFAIIDRWSCGSRLWWGGAGCWVWSFRFRWIGCDGCVGGWTVDCGVTSWRWVRCAVGWAVGRGESALVVIILIGRDCLRAETSLVVVCVGRQLGWVGT